MQHAVHWSAQYITQSTRVTIYLYNVHEEIHTVYVLCALHVIHIEHILHTVHTYTKHGSTHLLHVNPGFSFGFS